jgi:DNA-binding NarL/FixJ family response regulator
MRKRASVVIIEDHPIMREGLAGFLTKTRRWEVVGTASDIESARALLGTVTPELLLLDIHLKETWGLDILPFLPEKTVTVVYSNYDDYAHVSAALSLGVRAYVTKQRDLKELEAAMKKALSGGLYVDESAETRSTITLDKLKLLTKRETEIFNMVKSGLSNKAIAEKLGISFHTVENTIHVVYNKTGIRSRVDVERL